MSDIAVIGMACRFPGADDPDAFWECLAAGRSAIRVVPDERWKNAEYFDPSPGAAGKTYSRWAGLIEGVDLFDAAAFGISAIEAERMDPQQRLILEVARDAFEDAGLPRHRVAGSQTGVFVGISTFDYTRILPRDPASIDMYWGTGTAISIAANRLSYAFDLNGPSMAVDTACSSALVAVTLACRSLSDGECDAAIAGGVNLLLAPDLMIAFSAARMMAADGRCKAFDATADGYVRGEGCGLVVLKRLEDAISHGDVVQAVIRGCAVNQDGRTNGMTAPNGLAQERVIAAALRNAGATPAMIGYVEAHGTGTPLGDPIEAAALGAALGVNRPQQEPLAIGSVKTNIGHLEAAAGMAGLIKTVQALRHGRIPPSLNFNEPNPRIAFEQIGLRVATELADWPTDRPLAGVSSFGFGGTNAHVVLAPPPVQGRPHEVGTGSHVLIVSAPHAELLAPLALAHSAALEQRDAAAVADYCYSAAVRRSQYDQRLAVVAEDATTLCALLRAAASGKEMPGIFTGRRPLSGVDGPVFSFDGNLLEAIASAASLSSDHPVIRDALAECVEDGVTPTNSCVFLTALGMAQTALWASCGIHPSEASGHGAGELAAAATAGVLRREDALRLALAWDDANRVAGDAGAWLEKQLAWLRPRSADVPLWSETWGRSVSGESLDAAYWGALFNRMKQDPATRTIPARPDIVAVGTPQSGLTGSQAFAHQLCALFTRGHNIDWRGAFPGGGNFTKLPTTPFRRSRYWRGQPPGWNGTELVTEHPFRPSRLRGAAPVWETHLGNFASTALGRHLVDGVPVLPMSVGLSVASLAASQETGGRVQLVDVAFLQLIRIRSGSKPRLQIVFDSPPGEERTVKIHVADLGPESDDGAPQLWMTARLQAMPPLIASLHDAQAGGASKHRTIERIACPSTAFDGEKLPVLLSEAMELFRRIATPNDAPPMIVAGVGQVAAPSHDDPIVPGSVWASASLDDGGRTGELVLWDEKGTCICRLGEIRFHPHSPALQPQLSELDCAYRLVWQGLDPQDEPLHYVARARRAFGGISGDVPAAAGLDPVRCPAGGSADHGQHVFPARTCRNGRLLILTDELDGTSLLRSELTALGETAVVLPTSSEPALASEAWRAIVLMSGPPRNHGRELRETLQNAPGETLRILRALARLDDPPPLYVVTRNGVAASPQDDPDPIAAINWGLGRTAAAEMPGLWGGLIDIDGSPQSMTALAFELRSPGGALEIAFRGGRKSVPALARQAGLKDEPIPLRTEASYLITGGFGSMGLMTAEWLAARGARHLVLCGRSALSSDASERVNAMMSGGTTIVTTQIDVANEQALTSLLGRFGNDLPPLKGIIHAAGSREGGILASLDPASGLNVQTDKVLAANLLSRHTAAMDLDFLVFYSSATAAFGQAGSGLYSAANAYLDALAASLSKGGRPVSSIAFAPVAGTRMLEAAPHEQQERWRQLGIRPLDPTTAMAAVGCTLADGSRALIAINIDWARAASSERRSTLLDNTLATRSAVAVAERATEETIQPHRSAVLDEIRLCHPAERPRRIERYLHEVMARILHLPDDRAITGGEGFQSLGMNSLTALTFTDFLQRECGIRLPATTMFEYPNISALGRLLVEKLTGEAPHHPEPTKASWADVVAPIAFRGEFADIAALDDLDVWQEIDRVQPVQRQ